MSKARTIELSVKKATLEGMVSDAVRDYYDTEALYCLVEKECAKAIRLLFKEKNKAVMSAIENATVDGIGDFIAKNDGLDSESWDALRAEMDKYFAKKPSRSEQQ